MYKVEKNVEMPLKKTFTAGSKYPFAEMDIGDSFFVPATSREDAKKVQTRVSASGTKFRAVHGRRFSTRVIEENDGFGVRVWRIE